MWSLGKPSLIKNGWVGSPHQSPPAHRAPTCRCQPAGCSCGVIVRCPETLLTFISVLACIALCSKSLPLKYFTWSNLQVDHDWSQACLHQLLKIKKFEQIRINFFTCCGWLIVSQSTTTICVLWFKFICCLRKDNRMAMRKQNRNI